LPCAAGVLRDHSRRHGFDMPGLPDRRSGCRHNLRIDLLRAQASWILPVASQNHWMRNGEVGQPASPLFVAVPRPRRAAAAIRARARARAGNSRKPQAPARPGSACAPLIHCAADGERT
jgi:hypothetical protein